MSDDNKAELLEKCLKTLHDNSASFVVMLQVSPECQGECHWGGNYEACENMSKRVEEEFQSTLESNTEEETGEEEYNDGYEDE